MLLITSLAHSAEYTLCYEVTRAGGGAGGAQGTFSCALAKDSVYGQSYEQLFSAGRTPDNQWHYQARA